MGRTFKKNNRWKKDKHDQNFRKSKKFKEFKGGHPHQKPSLAPVEAEPIEVDDSSNY
jgi:hypothetical protein